MIPINPEYSSQSCRIRNADEGHKGSSLTLLVMASLIGASVTIGAFYIGNSYVVMGIAVVFAFFVVAFSGKEVWPFIVFASCFVGIPTNSSAALPCNLAFAVWLLIFRGKELSALPKWLLISSFLAIFAMASGSMNWMGEGGLLNLAQQSAHMFNFLLAPILVIPFMYQALSREAQGRDKLRVLLFCLILPTSVVLLMVHSIGKAIYHAGIRMDQQDGMMLYQVGNVQVDFLRTHVCIVLAALICATIPIVAVPLAAVYRLTAGFCLMINFYLMLVTGGVGSTLSGLLGCLAIFFFLVRKVRLDKILLAGVVLLGVLAVVWRSVPDSVHEYLERRYEERFGGDGKSYASSHVNADDRLMLWGRAAGYLLEHPEGMGWSLSYGDEVKVNSHNDYLLFAISYGVLGGFIYLYLVIRLILYFIRNAKLFDRPADYAIHLSGLGVIIVLAVNSMADHLAANKWYFNLLWSIVWLCFFAGYKPKARMKKMI